ncbi:MAG: hypothetical protein HYX43_07295 [Burkholderiales bacterium]|nr:hypothetical protein [Burkholderiales bacterium]
MPIATKFSIAESISLKEFVSRADQVRDIGTADGLWSIAEDFTRLGNNRDFLSNFFCEYIKSNVSRDPLYVVISQAIVLHRGKDYYIRANFWPVADECSPEEHTLFAYDQPHDHNFDLLSYSYCGDGYISDDYTYDYDKVIGYAGEMVDIEPLGAHKHECGDVLMYYCNRDIHIQHPPAQPSITLNVIPTRNENGPLDQYFFAIDGLEARKAKLVKRATNAIEQRRMYMAIAKEFLSENVKDVIGSIAARHECPRTRYEALRILRSVNAAEHDRLVRQVVNDRSPLLRHFLRTLEMSSVAAS